MATTRASTPAAPSAVPTLPVNQIRPSADNPRRHIAELELRVLADSIREHGVIDPILVRPVPADDASRYEIVAGERRWRASRLTERSDIPALVRELPDEESLEIAAAENLQRADLNALEEGRDLPKAHGSAAVRPSTHA